MKTRKLAICGVFTALTILGAFIRIPLPGTPLLFTLQTFFVFMAGLVLTPRYAFLSQLAYITLGLVGLPVFSLGGGIGYVLQPSFGFLLGFCACAPVISVLARKPLKSLVFSREKRAHSIMKTVIGILISVLVLYALGIIYMYLIFNLYAGKTVSLWSVTVSAAGVFIFIDLIKFALAVPICAAVYKRLPDLF